MNLTKKNPLNTIALSGRADDEPEELSAGVPSTYGRRVSPAKWNSLCIVVKVDEPEGPELNLSCSDKDSDKMRTPAPRPQNDVDWAQIARRLKSPDCLSYSISLSLYPTVAQA